MLMDPIRNKAFYHLRFNFFRKLRLNCGVKKLFSYNQLQGRHFMNLSKIYLRYYNQ